jgi:hypothetical protein
VRRLSAVNPCERRCTFTPALSRRTGEGGRRPGEGHSGDSCACTSATIHKALPKSLGLGALRASVAISIAASKVIRGSAPRGGDGVRRVDYPGDWPKAARWNAVRSEMYAALPSASNDQWSPGTSSISNAPRASPRHPFNGSTSRNNP